MSTRYIGYILLVCTVLCIAGTASADLVKGSPALDRASVMDRVAKTQYQSPLYASLKDYQQQAASGGPVNISISLVINSDGSNQYCSTCGTGWPYASPVYRFSINYPYGVPIYYPGPNPQKPRGYGSLAVWGPDDGNIYYLWIKSKFMATDVEPGYNMQWQYGGILPVFYENNILEGTYCLKVTSVYNPSAAGLWCGTAVIAANRTTSIGAIPSQCPFGCTCC